MGGQEPDEPGAEGGGQRSHQQRGQEDLQEVDVREMTGACPRQRRGIPQVVVAEPPVRDDAVVKARQHRLQRRVEGRGEDGRARSYSGVDPSLADADVVGLGQEDDLRVALVAEDEGVVVDEPDGGPQHRVRHRWAGGGHQHDRPGQEQEEQRRTAAGEGPGRLSRRT
ncbi:MAG: hypothetical protein DMF80_18835 [Acidobacteria bacterium]|nr:MAG: hypothetical protein DMF80_18835 [Acidobacteriota bacterium]